MPRVVHFELAADNIDRAQEFWSEVFGWKIQQWEGPDGPQPYWMISTGEEDMGIDGGMLRRSDAMEGTDSALVVGVSSIDEVEPKVKDAGGSQLSPKTAVGTMGWVAYFKDTEGTVFGLWETNQDAQQ